MKGTLYTYSVIHSAAEAFKDKTPYVIALVEAEGVPRHMARIEGYREGLAISIGMTVDFAGDDGHGNRTYRFN